MYSLLNVKIKTQRNQLYYIIKTVYVALNNSLLYNILTMKVSFQSQLIGNMSDKQLLNKSTSKTAFKSSLIYSPKSPLHTINPVVKYVDNYFQRALNISRRFWCTPIQELKPFINSVELNQDTASEIKLWDINKDDRKKYVIAMHGMGQNISKLQPLYKEILENTDYAILAPEYHGYTKGSKEKMYPRPSKFLANVTDAFNYLKQKGIEEKDIIVIGHSFGGYVATRLAKKFPNISRLILVCSMNSPIHIAESVKNGHMNANKKVRDLINNCSIAIKELNIFFNTSEHLKKVDVPVDIIQTKDDSLIELKTSDKLASKCKKLNRYTILDNGGHEMDDNKIVAIVSALKKQPTLDAKPVVEQQTASKKSRFMGLS